MWWLLAGYLLGRRAARRERVIVILDHPQSDPYAEARRAVRKAVVGLFVAGAVLTGLIGGAYAVGFYIAVFGAVALTVVLTAPIARWILIRHLRRQQQGALGRPTP
jgi:hypothetical protein